MNQFRVVVAPPTAGFHKAKQCRFCAHDSTECTHENVCLCGFAKDFPAAGWHNCAFTQKLLLIDLPEHFELPPTRIEKFIGRDEHPCSCGIVFDSAEEWCAHYITEMLAALYVGRQGSEIRYLLRTLP